MPISTWTISISISIRKAHKALEAIECNVHIAWLTKLNTVKQIRIRVFYDPYFPELYVFCKNKLCEIYKNEDVEINQTLKTN